MLSVRPKIAELSFQLFERSLHPELFDIYKTKTFCRGDYSAQVSITSAGHLITWQCGNQILSEVATSAHYPLPESRQMLSMKLSGKQSNTIDCRNGVKYSFDFHLEPTNVEVFWTFQEELSKTDQHEGVFHSFDSSVRIPVGAMSYIYAQTRNKTFSIQAFHTFPDDCAVLKTTSSITLP